MNDSDQPGQHRANLLPVMLAVSVAGFFCFVLILLTGGFFLWVIAVVLGFVLFCLIHYALWGAAMSKEVAGEREELELLEKAKEKPQGPNWTYRR